MSNSSKHLEKNYGLIVESDASLNVFSAINESSEDLPEGVLMRLRGTFIPMDVPGTNGRWYTYEDYKPHVDSLLLKIQRKELFGEIEHPQRVSVPYDLVSHRIDEVYFDKESNSWKGVISILDTERGRHLFNIARTGAPLYVSHRALGSMDKQTSKGIILKLITWDVTSIPSFNVAEFNKAVPINESAYNFIPLQGEYLNEAAASVEHLNEATKIEDLRQHNPELYDKLAADKNITIVGYSDVMDYFYVKKDNPLLNTKGVKFDVHDKVADDGLYTAMLNESSSVAKQYTQKQKQLTIDYWDNIFEEFDIKDKQSQNNVVRAFDKLEGDDYKGSIVELLSDSFDKANITFDYRKLEKFAYNFLNESDNSTEVKEGMTFEHDDKKWKVVKVGDESSKCKSGEDEQDIDNSVILENYKEKDEERVDEAVKHSDTLVKAAIAYTKGLDIDNVVDLSDEAKGYSFKIKLKSGIYTIAYDEVNEIIDVHKDALIKQFNLNESIAVEPSKIVDDIKSRKYITIQEYAKDYKYKDAALHPDDLFAGAISLAKEGLLYNADAIENKDEPEIAAILTAQQTADMLGALLAEEQAALNESSIDAFTKGDILKLKDDITLISLKELMNKELKFVEYVKSGLISQPLFAKVKVDNAFHEINPEYLTKFMNEGIVSWLKGKYNAIKRWANSSDTPLFTVDGQDYIVDKIKPQGEVIAIDKSGNKKTFTFDEVDKFINDCTNSKTKKNMINENIELQSLLDVLKSKKFVSKDENANEYDYDIVENGFLAMTADIAENIALSE